MGTVKHVKLESGISENSSIINIFQHSSGCQFFITKLLVEENQSLPNVLVLNVLFTSLEVRT